MFSEPYDPFLEKDPVELDEGWWESVLADEEAFIQSASVLEVAPQNDHPDEDYCVDWQKVQGLYERDEIVELEVYAYNRGGLLVHGNGVQGFVPVSHLVEIAGIDNEKKRYDRLAKYIGSALSLKVIECEATLERIVLSERAALAGEGQRKELFRSLVEGQVVEGTVTNVTDFGVFVDLGGVEGLIHVSELSWGRVRHPSDILKVNQKVRTLVLQVSEENVRVALSLKRLCENPWENIVEKYRPGDVLPATITAIMGFGVFARLSEGVEGLIHISSMNLPSGRKDIEKIFKPGDPVQVRVLHIDAGRRRMGLGLVSTA